MLIRFTLLICAYLLLLQANAQDSVGFLQIVDIAPLPVIRDTGETPQSKVWKYANKYWAVLPDTEGTHLWRLDNNKWTKVLTLTENYFKADAKVVDNIAHILLYRGQDTINLVSLEYVSAAGTYKSWSKNKSLVPLHLGKNTFVASIDVDGKGRMWLAYDTQSSIEVRWSDSPYTSWSEPVTLATGVTDPDIAAVIAMPGKIGVMWSDQNTQRFGFRTHANGAAPSDWSADEVPASQSAIDLRGGMANASINLAVSSDGTLYSAVKTSYNTNGYPRLALLVRRPSGTWDDLYEITPTGEFSGERPIVILNEKLGKLRVIYNTNQAKGNLVMYKESHLSDISFTPEMVLINGMYTDATSTKDNFSTDIVILASDGTNAVGVIAYDVLPQEECCKWTLYPNPFNDSTSLYFTTQEGGKYNLTIYSSSGEKLNSLSGETMAGEMNRIAIDGGKLSSGLYLVQLQTKEQSRVFKLILNK